MKKYLSTTKSAGLAVLFLLLSLALLALSAWLWAYVIQHGNVGELFESFRYLLSEFALEDAYEGLRRLSLLVVMPGFSVVFFYLGINGLIHTMKEKKQLEKLLRQKGEELEADFSRSTIFVHNNFRLGEKYLYIRNHGIPIANQEIARATFAIEQVIKDSGKKNKKGEYETEPNLKLTLVDKQGEVHTAFCVQPEWIDKWLLGQIKEAFRERNPEIEIRDMTVERE